MNAQKHIIIVFAKAIALNLHKKDSSVKILQLLNFRRNFSIFFQNFDEIVYLLFFFVFVFVRQYQRNI